MIETGIRLAVFLEKWLAFLTSLVFYPILFLLTVVSLIVCPVCLLMCRFFPGMTTGKSTRLMIWLYGRVWLALCYPLTEFRRINMGRDAFPMPCVLVVNHYSFFDTFFMAGLPFSDVTFVVKSWPFKMPWYRPFMLMARYIESEAMNEDDVVNRCREVKENQAAVLFYPEGRRSRDGRMGRFYSGAFKTALQLGLPVVPLCITGTRRFLGPGRRLIKPSPVTMEALIPVWPLNYPGELGHLQMRRDVRQMMKNSIFKTASNQNPA